MKVVIYESQMDSFFSILCSLVTGSGYSHSAVYNNGKLYDTMFKRGYFCEADPIDDDRHVLVTDIDKDCQSGIDALMGLDYDTLGLLLWPLGVNVAGKEYCHSATEKICDSVDHFLKLGWRKDGGTILSRLIDMGYTPVMMKGKQFNEQFLYEKE